MKENIKDTIKSELFQMKLTKILLISLICTIIGGFHAVYFNESRFIVPTDFATYEFRWADLIFVIPLTTFVISACIASVQYPIFILHRSGLATFSKYKLGERTPKVNNKLWLLGFGGFLGFLPLMIDLTLHLETQFASPYNVLFFGFFAHFTYYYQNKFSEILVDERFLFNAVKAEAKAYRIAFFAIIVSLILAAPRVSGNVLSIFLLTMIALSYAAAEILKAYYLYKYDIAECGEIEE